jgi:spore germination protein KC
MRVKQLILFVLVLCTVLFSTGCWDARDINEKSLITLVMTDRQNNKFEFYVEVPNLAPGQQMQDGAEQGGYNIISSSGDTYAQARRELDAQMDKPTFLGTVRALILTKELAQYSVEEYFYRMQTMLDYRRALEVITTQSTPQEVISAHSENSISLGYEIDDTISTLKSAGKLVTYTVSDVLNFLYARQSFVLVNMDAVNGRMTYTGYTVIKDGRYAGFVPLEEAQGLVWLLGSNIQRNYPVNMETYLATLEVKCNSREIKSQYIDGQVIFSINMSFNSRLLYMDQNISFDNRQAEMVKIRLQQLLTDDIAKAIDQSRSFDSDYLEFYDNFRISYPNIIKQLDWSSVYQNAVFNISSTTTLDPGGMMDMQAQGDAVP